MAGGLLAVVLVITVIGCGGSGSGRFLATTGEGASAGSVPNYQPTGPLIADNGFRPGENGFSFENYSNVDNPQNLGPTEMQQLFGTQVCARGTGGSCQLTPPAKQALNEANKALDVGHCYGFSVTALRFFKGILKPVSFGASNPFSLSLTRQLQSQIAIGAVAQAFPSVKAAEVNGTPNQLLDKLIQALKTKREYYTVNIFRPGPKGGRAGGHAVTPYAVEDKGGGKMNLLVYDNNYPGKTRAIQFDRNTDSWSYTAQNNPNQPVEEYKGDARSNTIELDPEGPSEGRQPCWFCNGQGGRTGGAASASGGTLPTAERYNQITLEGGEINHAHLLLTDQQGRKTGYDGAHFVQEIPGSRAIAPVADRDWEAAPEPSYRVPVGTRVAVTIDGSTLKTRDTETLELLGPGIDGGVENLTIGPGQKDQVTFKGDGTGFTFHADPRQTGTSTLDLGFTADSGDYGFAIRSLNLAGDSKIALALDRWNGKLDIDTTGTNGRGTYTVSVVRESKQGTQTFKHSRLSLAGGEIARLDYAAFTRQGEPVKLEASSKGQTRTEQLAPDSS